MEIRELRIGNYVIDSEVKMITKVTSISHNGELRLFCQGSSVGANNEEIEPIPLTEDILTKCGIYQSLGSPFYRKGKFAVDLLGHCEYKNVTIDAEISYIHTLQNIYFALTQQELEIKL